MCVIVFDEDRLDSWIYDFSEDEVDLAIKFIKAAAAEDFSIILSMDTADIYRRLRMAGSTKEFLTQLEKDAR